MSLCLCRYDVFLLKQVWTSSTQQHKKKKQKNKKQKKQSERRKNCWTQSATSTISKIAATEQELTVQTVAEQEILTAWIDKEALAEAVWCYPMLYDKSMKEFKDQNKCSLLHFSSSRISLCRCLHYRHKAILSLRRYVASVNQA